MTDQSETLLILGALATRTGARAGPLPGGCQLADRSFDLHELVFVLWGGEVWQENDMLCAEAPKGGLKGADIHLPLRSTGATENAIISGKLEACRFSYRTSVFQANGEIVT